MSSFASAFSVSSHFSLLLPICFLASTAALSPFTLLTPSCLRLSTSLLANAKNTQSHFITNASGTHNLLTQQCSHGTIVAYTPTSMYICMISTMGCVLLYRSWLYPEGREKQREAMMSKAKRWMCVLMLTFFAADLGGIEASARLPLPSAVEADLPPANLSINSSASPKIRSTYRALASLPSARSHTLLLSAWLLGSRSQFTHRPIGFSYATPFVHLLLFPCMTSIALAERMEM